MTSFLEKGVKKRKAATFVAAFCLCSSALLCGLKLRLAPASAAAATAGPPPSRRDHRHDATTTAVLHRRRAVRRVRRGRHPALEVEMLVVTPTLRD